MYCKTEVESVQKNVRSKSRRNWEETNRASLVAKVAAQSSNRGMLRAFNGATLDLPMTN